MKLNNIILELEKQFPLTDAEDWDNVGLLIGNPNQEIKKILITLDVTNQVVQEAIDQEIDLIIVHHPVIFTKLNNLIDNNKNAKLINLVKNDIAVFAMHTNVDANNNGMNKWIFDYLNIDGKSIKINNNIMQMIEINEIDLIELVNKLQPKYDYPLRFIKANDKPITRIGLVGGSGMSYLLEAKANNCDCFLTGDVKYHEALDAMELDINVIDIGHYAEHVFKENMQKIVSNLCDCEVVISEINTNPFKTI